MQSLISSHVIANQSKNIPRNPIFRTPEPTLFALRIDTLSISIDLQTLLCHFRVLEEIQWHPYQMPLDLVEFLPDFFGGHEWVVEMALLEFVVAGEEGGVVVEGFDCIYVLADFQ